MLSGLTTPKNPSIGLLDKYILIVNHHQLLAADIQQKIHTTIWINIRKFYWWCWGCRQEDKNTYNWCRSHEWVPYHTRDCIPPYSTKLQKGITHDFLGQDTEVKLIEFLTWFGYATRKTPTVQLHATHTHYCSDVNETKYIQGCDGICCIIPVTLFLVSLYNACFTFQHDKTTNLLISALDCFDLGTTVDNDTFMTTISKSTNST